MPDTGAYRTGQRLPLSLGAPAAEGLYAGELGQMAFESPASSRSFMTHNFLQSGYGPCCVSGRLTIYLKKMLLTWGQVSYLLAAWAIRGKDLSLASDRQG